MLKIVMPLEKLDQPATNQGVQFLNRTGKIKNLLCTLLQAAGFLYLIVFRPNWLSIVLRWSWFLAANQPETNNNYLNLMYKVYALNVIFLTGENNWKQNISKFIRQLRYRPRRNYLRAPPLTLCSFAESEYIRFPHSLFDVSQPHKTTPAMWALGTKKAFLFISMNHIWWIYLFLSALAVYNLSILFLLLCFNTSRYISANNGISNTCNSWFPHSQKITLSFKVHPPTRTAITVITRRSLHKQHIHFSVNTHSSLQSILPSTLILPTQQHRTSTLVIFLYFIYFVAKQMRSTLAYEYP